MNYFNNRALTLTRLVILSLFPFVSTSVLTHANNGQHYHEGRSVNTHLYTNWATTETTQFNAFIVFEISDKWHTYWKNPGTTGMATSFNWELPQGMVVTSIKESIPKHYDNQGLIDYVHEGTAIYVATIQLQDPNLRSRNDLSLGVKIDWLACSTLCVPGSSHLSIPLNDEIPVPATYETLVANLSNSYDHPGTGSFEVDNNSIHWNFPHKMIEAQEVKNAYFFPDTAISEAAAQQNVSLSENGTLIVSTQLNPYEPHQPETLSGWLKYTTSNDKSVFTRFDLINQKNQGPPTHSNLLVLIGLAFLGGLILNLMPCVFPVIGLKIMGFVEQAGQDKRKVMAHGLVFSSGVIVSFWLLSGILLVLHAGGKQLGWGFQLQEPWFNYSLILLLFAFALSLSGVFEFGMSAMGVGSGLQRKKGYSGSFFSGVLATIVATPCSAPFLAPALGAALTLQSWQALIVFTFIALGLSTPYLLLSAFPAALNKLPRPGAWMETFKQVMAFPLYATVGYLLWTLIGQIDEQNQLNTFLSIATFAMALWMFGKWGAPHKAAKIRKIAWVLSALLIIGSVWLGHPRKSREFWEKWSPEVVEKYVAEGKTVYVDFTARWCATCQLNKRMVFGSKEILQYFEENDVVALKADWTNRDAIITQRLKELGKAAVPVNLVYKNGEDEPVILPEILNPKIVIEALSTD